MNNMITAFALAGCIGDLGESGPAEASFASKSVRANAPSELPRP